MRWVRSVPDREASPGSNRSSGSLAPIDEVSVMHSTTPDEASSVADELSDLLAGDKEPIVARMGPVVGTYAGPGVLGMGVLRSSGS